MHENECKKHPDCLIDSIKWVVSGSSLLRWILSSNFKHSLYNLDSQVPYTDLQFLCITTCAVRHSIKSPEFIAAADSVDQADHEEVTGWGDQFGGTMADITILQLQ